MMLAGLARLGRDCEVSYTAEGQPVGNLSLAYNYGKKGPDGKRPTQWIDAALWGERAEKLADYLKKGKQVYIVLDDVYTHAYQKKDGTQGMTLRARVGQIEFAGDRESGGQSEAAPKPTTHGAAALEDDIPFAPYARSHAE